MAKTGQKSRKMRQTSDSLRPRKKARMGEEGTTGEQTSLVKQMAERESKLFLMDGVSVVVIDGRLHRVPNELWAWTPSSITYRRCRECSFRDDCRHVFLYDDGSGRPSEEYAYTTWTRELLCAAEVEQIGDFPKALAPQFVPTLPRGVRDVATTAGQFPPELFQRIYRWDDARLARRCRLVCRYWEKQCRRAVFREINLKSEERVLNLARRFKRDSAWQHIPPLVEQTLIPMYTAKTKVPWLHLLDPRWKRHKLLIVGPFPGRRTLRSIHVGLC